MAKRKRVRKGRKGILLGIIALALAASLALVSASIGWKGIIAKVEHLSATGSSPIEVSSARVDPINEARDVRITGSLEIGKQPVDPQLSVTAKAAILFRHVEMYQWREQCSGADCRYDKLWSSLPIDSHGFRVQQGHENAKFPFTDAHFAAPDIKIGAFTIDPSLLLIKPATQALPVTTTQLPPNLAVTFGDADGVLYAGADPAHAQIGALRISYQISPLRTVTLVGVQRGARLSRH
ncbi:MAG: TMEM43 family protein [Rudaea sp.]